MRATRGAVMRLDASNDSFVGLTSPIPPREC